MINPQWLKLPMSRTHLHNPKDVRLIEVRLYIMLVASPIGGWGGGGGREMHAKRGAFPAELLIS